MSAVDKVSVVPTSSGYGSIQDSTDDRSTPVKEGIRGESPYHTPVLRSQTWWTRYYSTAGLIAVVSGLIFTILLVTGVVFTQLPASYTRLPTAQTRVISLVDRVDPFFYNQAEIGTSSDKTLVVSVASLDCLELVSLNEQIHSQSALNLTRKHGNEPLQLLWKHSYLVSGSSLIITIAILHPSSNEAAPTLYLLNNWDLYTKLYSSSRDPSITDQYIARYPINKAGNTTIVMNVTSTDFYFFMLYLPAETVFQYQFWLDRVYYSPDDYNFTCNTSSSTASLCPYSLAPSYILGNDVQCMLVLLKSDIITNVRSRANRNPVNIPFFATGLMVLLSLLICLLLVVTACILQHVRVYKKRNSPYTRLVM